MLPESTFACSAHHGVVTCSARSPSAEVAYQQLSICVKTALGAMARAGVQSPVQEITIGSTIGAAMVIAVQGIIGMLAVVAQPPQTLHPLLSTQTPPGQLVAIIGTHADDVVAYINQVLMARPDAFLAAQQPAPPIGSPAQQAIGFFTFDRVVAIGASALVLGGLVYFARSSDKRLGGKVDRTDFLADEEDDDDVGDDDTAELPPVIDAESVEVASAPA